LRGSILYRIPSLGIERNLLYQQG
jgi:DNA-binding transcriptional ArsR family regulator